MNGLSAAQRPQRRQRPQLDQRPQRPVNGLSVDQRPQRHQRAQLAHQRPQLDQRPHDHARAAARPSPTSSSARSPPTTRWSRQDQNGNNYTFAGGIGLCPAWKNGGISTDSPVHGGALGLHDGPRQHRRRPRPALARLERLRHRLGHRPRQLPDAGGDVLRRHHRHRLAQQRRQAEVNGPVAYYCDGAGFPAGASRRRRRPPRRQPDRRSLREPLRQRRALPEPHGQRWRRQRRLLQQRRRRELPERLELEPAPGCPDGYRDAVPLRQRRPSLEPRHHRVAEQQLHAGVRHQLPVHALRRRHPAATRWSSTAGPRRFSSGTSRPSSRHLGLQHDAERQQLDPLAGRATRASASTPAPAPTAPASCSPPATAARPQSWTITARRADRQLLRQGRQHRSLHERPRRQHRRRRRHGGRRLQLRLDQPEVQHPGDRRRRRHL